MRSRKYIHRIEIFQTSRVSDNFGGYTISNPTLIGSSWCNIKTLRAERVTDLGLNENDIVIEINLRHREDINYTMKNMYFRYQNRDFNIIRIEPVDLEKFELKIIASSKLETTELTPNTGFPLTFPITLS